MRLAKWTRASYRREAHQLRGYSNVSSMLQRHSSNTRWVSQADARKNAPRIYSPSDKPQDTNCEEMKETQHEKHSKEHARSQMFAPVVNKNCQLRPTNGQVRPKSGVFFSRALRGPTFGGYRPQSAIVLAAGAQIMTVKGGAHFGWRHSSSDASEL